MQATDRLSGNMAARLIIVLNFISLAVCTTFDTYCNRTLTGLFGEIRSPNYPNQYPTGVSCLWVIDVDQGYDGIALQFKKFLTRQSNTVSSDEALLIYTENPDVFPNVVPVRVLQGEFPNNFIFRSQSTGLWLKFQSSTSGGSEQNENLGFDILYSVVTSSEQCGNPDIPENGIMIGSNFTVGFHVQYYCNHGYRLQGVYQLICVIRSASGQPQWSDPTPICLNTCPDPTSEHLKFRGAITMNSTISFSCDPPYSLRGASQASCMIGENGVLQWDDIPLCYIPDCTRPIVLNQYNGSIVNPSYPRHIVQGEKHCRWQIFGKPNTIIRVYFIYFDLPADGESYLEIKDKGGRRSRVLVRVQGGGSAAHNVTSQTNHIEIRYSGPQARSTTHRGFYMSYQTLPEIPIVELEDDLREPTRTTINMGTVTTTMTSSRKPIIFSSTHVIRHPDNGTDTVKIAVGVSVPVVIGLIVVLGLYLWYRKKYPVRMIMGREFGKFYNPDYQVRSSTLTLVREDADEFFHSDKAASSLTLASEHQPTGSQYDNIAFQSDSEGSRSLSRAEEEEEEDRKLMQRKSYLFTHQNSNFTDDKSSSSDSDSSESSRSRTQVQIEQDQGITDVGGVPTADYENVDLTQQKNISKSDLPSDDRAEKSEETATISERQDDATEETKVGRRAATFNESPMRRYSIDPSLSVRGRSQSVVVVGEYGLIDPRLAKYSTLSESTHSGRARSMSVVVSGNRDRVTNATNSDSSGSISSQTQVGIGNHANIDDDSADVPTTDYENVLLTQQKNISKSDEQNVNAKDIEINESIPIQKQDGSGQHVDDNASPPTTDYENVILTQQKNISKADEQTVNTNDAETNVSIPSQKQVDFEQDGITTDNVEVPTADYESIDLTQQKHISKSADSYQSKDVDSSESSSSQTHDTFEQHRNTADNDSEVPTTDYENINLTQQRRSSKQSVQLHTDTAHVDPNSSIQDNSRHAVSDDVKVIMNQENDNEYQNITFTDYSQQKDSTMSSKQNNSEKTVITKHGLISEDKTLGMSSEPTDESISCGEHLSILPKIADDTADNLNDSVHNKDRNTSSHSTGCDSDAPSDEKQAFSNSSDVYYEDINYSDSKNKTTEANTPTETIADENINEIMEPKSTTAETNIAATAAEDVVSISTDSCDEDEYENVLMYKNKTNISDSEDHQCKDDVTPHVSDDENYENITMHHGLSFPRMSDDKEDIEVIRSQMSKRSSSHLQEGPNTVDTLINQQESDTDTMIKDDSKNEHLKPTLIDTSLISDTRTTVETISSEPSVSLSKCEKTADRPILSSSDSNQRVDNERNSSNLTQVVPECLVDAQSDSETNPFEQKQTGNQSIMVTDLDDDSSLSSFNQSFLDSSIDASSIGSDSPYIEKKVLAVSEPKVQSLPKKLLAPVLDFSESTNDEYSSSDEDDNFERVGQLGGIGSKSFPATAGVLQLPGIKEEPDSESETQIPKTKNTEMGKAETANSNKVELSVHASKTRKSDDGVLGDTDSSDEESSIKFTDQDILNALDSDASDDESKQSQSYTVNLTTPSVINTGTSDRYVFGEENDDIDV